MDQKENLIARIVEIEWKMFHNVQNVGGTAQCQEDPQTFEIMRTSQAISWSEAVLESYLGDLQQAEKSDRNLMTEKYARMMQSTSPLEYAEIEHLLPSVDPQVFPLIDAIAQIVLKWEEELVAKYPYILQRGRPIHSAEDTLFATSLETYLRGELSTFSLQTLQLYLDHLQKLQSENINGSALTLEHTLKRYGFSSLEQANQTFKSPPGAADGGRQ